MFLLLLEQIVLLLDESLKADFLHFPAELIVLLFKVLDVLVLHSQLADLIRNLLLLLHQLLLEIILNALNFVLFLRQLELSFLELSDKIIIA